MSLHRKNQHFSPNLGLNTVLTDLEEYLNIDWVYRKELKKLATSAGVKPKFLFPEVREDKNNGGWDKGTISKRSYQELIKILFKYSNVDPENKDATGKILLKVDEFGMELSDKTIRDILDETYPSRLLNGNRRSKKRNT